MATGGDRGHRSAAARAAAIRRGVRAAEAETPPQGVPRPRVRPASESAPDAPTRQQPAARTGRPDRAQPPAPARAAAGSAAVAADTAAASRARPARTVTAPDEDPPPEAPTSETRTATRPPNPRIAERRSLRYRVLPRSLLGIAALILSFALGAGFSGVVLYSYYQYHLDQTNDRVNSLIGGYKKQFQNAEGDLQAQSNAAKTQIQNQLAPLQQLQADPKELARLVKTLAPSLYFVHTQDASGQASVGTAFVIASNNSQSLLLTSATTVAASQATPGPTVYVSKNNNDTRVTVRSVDTQYDLALIVLPQGNLPVIKVAPSNPAPQIGDKVYAMSGLGSQGASASEGSLVDVSSSGVAENAPIGAAFQGGPIVNSNGRVVAIASKTYSPQGFSTDSVWYAPFPQAACSKVLSCPSGSIAASQ